MKIYKATCPPKNSTVLNESYVGLNCHCALQSVPRGDEDDKTPDSPRLRVRH